MAQLLLAVVAGVELAVMPGMAVRGAVISAVLPVRQAQAGLAAVAAVQLIVSKAAAVLAYSGRAQAAA
jgi:hypothetical protein